MVERINQPEAPPTYQILPTKEAKDDESRRQEYEEGEEKYQKAIPKGDWGKYRGRNVTIKPARVSRNQIDRLVFKNLALQKGAGILEASVIWKDGRSTESAIFLLSKIEDYLKLKAFHKGATIPESFWATADEIEMGIVQEETSSGSWNTKELEAKSRTDAVKISIPFLLRIGLVDARSGRFQWLTFFIYVAVLTTAVMIILHASTR